MKSRTVAIVAAAAVLLGVATGVVLLPDREQFLGTPGGAPSESTSAPPSSLPSTSEPSSPESSTTAGDLTELLPVVRDFNGVWENNAFTEGDTYVDAGPELRDATCITAGQLGEVAEPGSIARRDFTGDLAHSFYTGWVMEFEDSAAADVATDEISKITEECLADNEKPNGPFNVKTGTGVATVCQALTEVEGNGQTGIWDSVGVVTEQNRVLVLSLTFRSPESHFEYEDDSGTGLPMHPQVLTLPKVADRLA